MDLKLFGGDSFFYPIKDNTYLCFKTLEKTDKSHLEEGFRRLSQRSIFHRFFGFMKELPESQIQELLNTDQENHVAWTAFDIVNGEPYGIGLGRFKRSKTNPEEAELALTIIDEYQSKGVGTVLLGIMYAMGIRLGIKVFTGIILADQTRFIRRFKELGAELTRIRGEYEMRLPIFADLDQIPKTRYSRVLRPVLQFLKENQFCS